MFGVWRTLLWKEWREQRSAVFILTGFFVLVPAMFSLRTPTNYFSALTFTYYAIPLVSMFVAMNVAAGEQSARTIGFLQALPVSRRKAAAAKLLWAILAVVTPICIAVGVAALLRLAIGYEAFEAISQDPRMFGREGGNWFATRLILPSLVAVSFLLWIAAPGVNLSDEVRAGAVGLLVATAYWAGVGLIAYLLDRAGSRESTVVWALSAIGAGGIASFDQADVRWAPYWGLAILFHLTLAAWFVTRFGRVAPGHSQAVEPIRAAQPTTWLTPPRRSPMSAIAWKQVRESLPLAAMGAGCIAAIGLFVNFAARREGGYGADDSSQLLTGMAVGWLMVGMMVSTVAGIGVFMEDLAPGLHSFWRSRPIRLGQWFAVKYVTGFVITLVTLAIPLVAVGVYVSIRKELPQMPIGRVMGEAQAFVASAALAQWALYNCAMAAIILLRRPIHAAFAAIAVSAAVYISAAIFADAMHRASPGSNIGLLLMLTLAIGFACGAAALAWFAVRNDWGWKR